MAQRVPIEASRDVQASVSDIWDAIDELRRKIQDLSLSATVNPADVSNLQSAVEALRTKPTHFDFNDAFRGSGPAHAMGFVPDPGEGTWDERVLSETGKWTAPVLGLIRAVTRQGVLGSKQYAGDIISVLASLAVIGNIGANKAFLKDLDVTGDPTYGGMPITLGRQLKGVGFSAGQSNSGTGETILTGYSVPILANTVRDGDTIHVHVGTLVAASNVNAKTLRLYIGAGAASIIWTSSANVVNHRGYADLWITRRSSTSYSVSGFYAKDMSGASGTPTWVFVNTAISGVDFTTDQSLYITAQGGAGADLTMTDYSVMMFNGNGSIV